ncbi:DegQ family serine endoprotease [bacterium]|nr:DegQ family serine endoprotease [bacterium]
MNKLKKLLFVILLIVGLLTGSFTVGLWTAGHYFKNKTITNWPIKEPIIKEATWRNSESYQGLLSLEDAFAKVAEEVKPAVVNISIKKTVNGGNFFRHSEDNFSFRGPFDDFFENFFGDVPEKYTQKSLGSGVIIDERGYILTNHHVIKGADEIMVTLLDGRKFEGKIKGSDPKTDLALIKIEADNHLPTVTLGDSDKIKVGSWVLAIGNPFGLEHTVTVGVVSAKGRGALGLAEYEDFIQTDASINPGNSGGPLVNLNGEVIGINTAIVAQAQGIGFAIPINMAQKIVGDLRKHGKVIRAWLGILIQDLTQELAKHLKAEVREGVLVATVVKGSPAEEAGLEEGDIILEIDGKKVAKSKDLQGEVLNKAAGTKVKLLLLRDGKKRVVTVTLSQMPEDEEVLANRRLSLEWRGMKVEPITDEEKEEFKLRKDEKGVIVTKVTGGSPADETELKAGDVIKRVNNKRIEKFDDFKEAISKIKEDEGGLLLIKRGGMNHFVVVEGK